MFLYLLHGGYEINKRNFEVLCGYGYAWVKVYNHMIPPNAVATVDLQWRTLIVGRGHHSGSLSPGLVSVSQRCLFLPYGGREIRVNNYEVLVKQ
ncbi:hypothetical protein EVAR_73341_1 [Eumeta japonica]|uniref:Uncharacterized protein n=1 Tax=Eumeta variegata TaxID=151549 RepID=A0A4C1SYC7_EUMVA|nr:hypothetical protein EVAR_73341_1 [Eumeta japonica]